MTDQTKKQIDYLLKWDKDFRTRYPVEHFENDFERINAEVNDLVKRAKNNPILKEWIMTTLIGYEKQYAILQKLQNE